MVELYFDGACEPINPGGTASFGWHIKKDGQTILHDHKVIGTGPGMTNNLAEYTGLLEGIKALKMLPDAKDVSIYGDSNLVCSMVSKKWGWNKKKTVWEPHKDAPHLRVLLDQILELLKDYNWTITWIPREKNSEADNLSKKHLSTK